ncbi:MAG: tetratricopeptide repeat protein [Rhodospirillaceae bacterium]
MAKRSTANIPTFEQAVQCHQTGNLTAARSGYRAILRSNPKHAECLHLLGVVEGQMGNHKKGITFIQKSIALRPDFAKPYGNLGLLHQKSGSHEKAAKAFTRAIELDPHYEKAWNNLAVAYADMEQIEPALEVLRQGIKFNPKSEPLYDNACRFYKRNGDYLNCKITAKTAIDLFPGNPTLRIHLAHACFALGAFDEAWDAYRWRNQHPDNPNKASIYPIPFWQGEDLSQKSILIWNEQGPGETFLFSTVLPEIISAAAQCIIVTPRRLAQILQRSFPKANVVAEESSKIEPSTADLQSSMADACGWLRRAWDDFPAPIPHIVIDKTLSRKYAEHVLTEETKDKRVMRVGIAWKSFNTMNDTHKSVSLMDLHPVFEIPGIKFVNLQYGDVREEISALKNKIGVDLHIENLGDPLVDLDDHLAHIASLDLVITTSNTTAHAAGSIGMPTWVLLPHTLGEGLYWPWFVNRVDSPWYKNTTLYRQKIRKQWHIPIQRMALDLAKLKTHQNEPHSEFAKCDATTLSDDLANAPMQPAATPRKASE